MDVLNTNTPAMSLWGSTAIAGTATCSTSHWRVRLKAG